MRLLIESKEEGIGISVSESLRLFCTDIPILSFVVLYAPSGTRYVWLHLQTWKDASFLYEMLNGMKVILTVELKAHILTAWSLPFGEFFSFLFVPEYVLLTARFCGSSKVMWEGWFNVFIVLKKYEKDDSILL